MPDQDGTNSISGPASVRASLDMIARADDLVLLEAGIDELRLVERLKALNATRDRLRKGAAHLIEAAMAHQAATIELEAELNDLRCVIRALWDLLSDQQRHAALHRDDIDAILSWGRE